MKQPPPEPPWLLALKNYINCRLNEEFAARETDCMGYSVDTLKEREATCEAWEQLRRKCADKP